MPMWSNFCRFAWQSANIETLTVAPTPFALKRQYLSYAPSCKAAKSGDHAQLCS